VVAIALHARLIRILHCLASRFVASCADGAVVQLDEQTFYERSFAQPVIVFVTTDASLRPPIFSVGESGRLT
jgi:hypothetical protein